MPRTTKAKLTKKKLDQLHDQLNIISAELNTAFLEKSNEIEGFLIGLIADENVCLVGPAGEAKSGLTNAFTSLLGGDCFSYQVSAYTQPDHVFGTESLKELRDNDRKVLKTANMAPDADICYLDECFKANNQMMNSLLLFLNEREVDVGEGIRQKTKNRMVIGTSNEYPEDDELKAFWDRWTIRFHTTGLKSDSSFLSFWNGYGNGSIGVVDAKKAMKLTDIDLLRKSLWLVDSSTIIKNIVSLRFELIKNGITLSTRRWAKIKKILHAVALRSGRFQSSRRDLKFLEHCLWSNENERELVANCISEAMGGELNVANKARAVAQRLLQEITQANIPDGVSGIPILVSKMEDVKEVVKEAEKLDLSDPEVASVVESIRSIQSSIAKLINDRVSG